MVPMHMLGTYIGVTESRSNTVIILIVFKAGV